MAAPNCTHFQGLAHGGSQLIHVKESAAATGKLFAILNPERVPVYVRDVCIEIVTKSTAACTVNIGTATSDATSDNLIDGVSIAACPAHTLYDNHHDAGTNGTTRQYLDVGDYVTGYVASGDANGAELNVSVMLQLISGGITPFP